jgi:hypothetical protein
MMIVRLLVPTICALAALSTSVVAQTVETTETGKTTVVEVEPISGGTNRPISGVTGSPTSGATDNPTRVDTGKAGTGEDTALGDLTTEQSAEQKRQELIQAIKDERKRFSDELVAKRGAVIGDKNMSERGPSGKSTKLQAESEISTYRTLKINEQVALEKPSQRSINRVPRPAVAPE